MQLGDSGLITEWVKRGVESAGVLNEDKAVHAKEEKIILAQLQGPFIMVAIGFIGSFLALLGEIVTSRQ